MSTTTHKRSVHIEAPAERVFDYVQDPEHFYAAMAMTHKHPEEGASSLLTGVMRTEAGSVTSYSWKAGQLLGFHVGGVMTREEVVPNERIVDHSSTGPIWTWTLQPDDTGTTLSLGYEYSTKVPLADKVLDRVGWKGDQDLGVMLARIKDAIES